ncbi:hypothetical protein [Methylocystis sp. S23]
MRGLRSDRVARAYRRRDRRLLLQRGRGRGDRPIDKERPLKRGLISWRGSNIVSMVFDPRAPFAVGDAANHSRKILSFRSSLLGRAL